MSQVNLTNYSQALFNLDEFKKCIVCNDTTIHEGPVNKFDVQWQRIGSGLLNGDYSTPIMAQGSDGKQAWLATNF